MAAGPRVVEVRLATLPPLLAEARAAGDDWMSAQERTRYAAMRSRKRQEEFLAGHWLARRLAAEVFGGVAIDYLLESAANGAPCLRRQDGGLCSQASLSHSGDWLAAALAPSAIGVDVEVARKPRDLLALAGASFAPAEVEGMRALPASELADAFYLSWTAREAIGKREGHGLRLELARRQRLQACASDLAELLCWQFEGGCLALAGDLGLQARVLGLPGTARAGSYRMIEAA